MSRRNAMSTLLGLALVAWMMAVAAAGVGAQEVRIRDLVLPDVAPPVRLMGYGLVTGLSGTGDRAAGGGNGSRQTVQSVVNLLRRFDVEVPAQLIQLRNVAAVLVIAEVSPYLRPGGRFEVKVSSIGDAQSLHGGVLWMTPLVSEAGGRPVAGAQGSLVSTMERGATNVRATGTSARIPDGGVLEMDLPRPQGVVQTRLNLREPDINTASRIAAVVDSLAGGPGNAEVEDPGSVRLILKDTLPSLAAAMARVRDFRIRMTRVARVVIDGRDGTVVSGGDVQVGAAVVSHAGITLSIGAKPDSTSEKGDVRLAVGATVQQIAAALHAVQSTGTEVASVFEALRSVGALAAEVVVR